MENNITGNESCAKNLANREPLWPPFYEGSGRYPHVVVYSDQQSNTTQTIQLK